MVLVEKKRKPGEPPIQPAKAARPKPAAKPKRAGKPKPDAKPEQQAEPAQPPKPPRVVLTPEQRAVQSARDRARHREKVLKWDVQHQPLPIGKLGPIEFSRCQCGFTLATYEGRTYWLRITGTDAADAAIRDVTEPEELAYALRTSCQSVNWKEIKQNAKLQKEFAKQQKELARQQKRALRQST